MSVTVTPKEYEEGKHDPAIVPAISSFEKLGSEQHVVILGAEDTSHNHDLGDAARELFARAHAIIEKVEEKAVDLFTHSGPSEE